MDNKKDFSRVTPPIGMGGRGPGGPGGPGGGPGKGMLQEKVRPKDTKETIKRLLNYLGKYKISLVLSLFFATLNSIATIYASYMIRPIINLLVDNSSTAMLINNLFIMAVIYVVAVLSSYIQSRLMLTISQHSLAKLRKDLFLAMQKLPLKFFDSNKKGEVMSRFTNDVDIINQMLSTTAVSLVTGVFTLIMTVGIMLYTNWFLAIITLLITPIFSRFSKFISKKAVKFYKKQQESIGNLNGFIEEHINGQKVIKVFNHEEEVTKNYKELNKTYRDSAFNAQFLGGVMGPIMGSIAQLSYIITACIGGILCVLGRFDVGGFVIFLTYAKSFSRPVNDIFMQVNNIFSALAGAERVFAVMNEQPEEETGNEMQTIQGDVEIQDITFGYMKNNPVLKNVSISAKRTQKIAFVGSTGAGKTTIANLLNRFYDIDSGAITIDGLDIKAYDKSYLRQNIAVVLQDTHLFTGSIMENVRYGRLDATDQEVIEACKAANADRFIRRLDKGYDTDLTGDGVNLSQGQRQLLNIARAAISKAPILILDEATSSVDTRTERHIEVALNRLMNERTTFIIAHRLSTVRNSDKIVVLDFGKIIESGTHEELLSLKGKYYSLYTGAEKLS